MIKKILSGLLCLATVNSMSQQDYPIHSVPFTQVKLTDNFWLPRIEINRTVTIPASFERCRNTGRIKNFEMAVTHTGKFCTTYPFDDTDIYKTIEGASFSLAVHPDKQLEAYLDSLITLVGKAQEPDGYLYTARSIDPSHPHAWSGNERWVLEHEQSHELYNAGHMYEAAYAHYMATGKRNFLDIALKNADLLVSVFGPDKRHVAPGHEIVEMGLVKLYRVTGKQAYLDLAKFFIDQRGERKYDEKSTNVWENGMYWQANKPVIQQDEAVGHAVRAMYLYSAVADIAALTGDTAYLHAIDKIWENVVTKKIYVQGGLGARGDGERFGENYELPNLTAYNETCAAIGEVYWNYRMFLLHGDSKYMDVLEKALYNGLISGVGMDGKSFFYTNAMQVRGDYAHSSMEQERSGWFECSCCPTNICRLIPSVPGYMYAQKDNNIYVNLFISGSAQVTMGKNAIELVQQNNYPWDGDLQITVNPKSKASFGLLIRIPGWAMNEAIPSDLYSFEQKSTSKATISVNGQPVDYTIQNGYAVLNRAWKKGDLVKVSLPMEVRKVVANAKVKDDIGKVALQRGPLMYCAEWPDNNGRTGNIIIPTETQFTTEYKADLLHGVTVLKSQVIGVNVTGDGVNVSTAAQPFLAIPYYAWAHRGKGEMNIWFPEKIKQVELISARNTGKESLSQALK